MALDDILRCHVLAGHYETVGDTEATQLMLEALFDLKAAVYEIHAVVVGEDENDEEEEEDA